MGNSALLPVCRPLLSQIFITQPILFNKLYQHGIEALLETIQGVWIPPHKGSADVVKPDNHPATPCRALLPRIILAQIAVRPVSESATAAGR